MKILIVGLVKNFQVLRLTEEGEKRGHTVDACKTGDLIIYSDKRIFNPKISGLDITSYDLIYSFATKRRWEWYLTFLYLSKKYKTKVVNQRIIDKKSGVFLTPISIIDYYRQTKSRIDYPKSVTFYTTKGIPEIKEKIKFPMIVKSSVGKQGKLVFKVDDEKEIEEKIRQLQVTKDAIVAREFIPNDGDVRVFTIGYKAIGAMKRTPKEGEFRSNISQGGSGLVFDLEKHQEVAKLAEKEARITKTDIAGVDVIINKETNKPYILEINSNPQFQGLEKYTGLNIAGKIIEYFEELVSR